MVDACGVMPLHKTADPPTLCKIRCTAPMFGMNDNVDQHRLCQRAFCQWTIDEKQSMK
jgi:hypothetical protein